MTSALQSPSPAAVHWTTPGILKYAVILCWAVALLLLLSSISAARQHRRSMKTIGRDSAPSIIAAQHIKSALADMDANAANELLGVSQAGAAVKGYEERRREATKALIEAAENITYGDAERIPLQNLELAIGAYETKIQQARDLRVGRDPNFLVPYREAAAIMDRTLLPAADALDKANRDVLHTTYQWAQTMSIGTQLLVWLCGLVLIAILGWLQLFLSRRMKRTFNPMLIAATGIAGFFLIFTSHALGSVSYHLRVATEDAFASIHALWQARAGAYGAKAAESRYLLDPANAHAYEVAFFDQTARLARLPGQTFAQVTAMAAAGKIPAGFTGYLADELRNITFPGERAAALAALSALEDYMAIDQKLRDLEEGGKHAAAIELCTGTRAGQSDWAFERFDRELGRTIAINQRAFDGAVEQGFAAVSGFEWLASLSVLLVALLTLFGVLPRIREYA